MGPRIFGIIALHAPVAAVIRRGPSDWMHLSRWDLETPAYEPGAWLRGTIYPQRCDLSPDGRWFSYFALNASAEWELGPTYIVISRLPWLTALAAWGIGSTWTRGMQFVEDRAVFAVDEPDLGDLSTVRERYGLRLSRADSFAVERRRGWTETPDTPPRPAEDAWDERRGDTIVMEKPRPHSSGSDRLTVRGTYAAIRELHGRRTVHPVRAPLPRPDAAPRPRAVGGLGCAGAPAGGDGRGPVADPRRRERLGPVGGGRERFRARPRPATAEASVW
jgi:hypothetical protein